MKCHLENLKIDKNQLITAQRVKSQERLVIFMKIE